MCDSRASENMSRNEETSSQESRYERTILYKTSHLKNPEPFEGNVNNLDMAEMDPTLLTNKTGQKSPRNTIWPFVLENVTRGDKSILPNKPDQEHGSTTQFYY